MSREFEKVLIEKIKDGTVLPNDFGPMPTFPVELPEGVNPLAISCWIGSC